jgi:hypothetical protein
MLKCSERGSRTPGFPAHIMAFVSPGVAHVTCAMRTLFSAANAKDVAQFGVQCRVEKRSYCYPERHGGDLHITFYPRTGVCGQETSEHHWVGFFFLNTLELLARSRLVRCVSESERGGDSVGRTQALCGGVGDAGIGDGDWI